MILGFFKNIAKEIKNGNKEVAKAIDDVFEAKSICGKCFGYNCCEGTVDLPVVDGSTKRHLYVVNNQLFFGTMDDVNSVRSGGPNTGTRLDV